MENRIRNPGWIFAKTCHSLPKIDKPRVEAFGKGEHVASVITSRTDLVSIGLFAIGNLVVELECEGWHNPATLPEIPLDS